MNAQQRFLYNEAAIQQAEEVEDRNYAINSRMRFNLSVLRLRDFLQSNGDDILDFGRLIGPRMRQTHLIIQELIRVMENGTIADLRKREIQYARELIQQFQVLPPIISVEQVAVDEAAERGAIEEEEQQAQQVAQQLHEALFLNHFLKKEIRKFAC